MMVGVLALQGGFAEHIVMLKRLGIETGEVRLPGHLDGLDGLIIPGGESTTIGKLAVDFGLIDPIRDFGRTRAVWGTCAGAVLLSKDAYQEQPLFKIMDISIRRNAFGSQLNSFEADLDITALNQAVNTDKPYRAIFIRAPIIESVSADAKVLSTLPDGRIVAVQQGKLLATAFHPELTGDTRFHEFFISFLRMTPLVSSCPSAPGLASAPPAASTGTLL
jgi:5'-phosphate synthase pdxT subunit